MLAAIVGFVLASAGMHQLLQWWHREPAVPTNLAQRAWVETPLATVVFDTPWALHADKLDLPAEIKDLVKSSAYIANEVDGLTIGAMEFSFAQDIDVPSRLDGAADGALANLRTPPGTLSVDPHKSDTTVLGNRAIELDARIRRDGGEPLRAHGVVLSDNNSLFILIAVARADQAGADTAWNRILKSIRARSPAASPR